VIITRFSRLQILNKVDTPSLEWEGNGRNRTQRSLLRELILGSIKLALRTLFNILLDVGMHVRPPETAFNEINYGIILKMTKPIMESSYMSISIRLQQVRSLRSIISQNSVQLSMHHDEMLTLLLTFVQYVTRYIQPFVRQQEMRNYQRPVMLFIKFLIEHITSDQLTLQILVKGYGKQIQLLRSHKL
jgi:hypothetical protein